MKLFMFSLLLMKCFYSDSASAFKEGKAFAQGQNKTGGLNASKVPGFKGAPKISSENLESRGNSALNNSEAGLTFLDSGMQSLDIMPDDPMLIMAGKIQANPTKTMELVVKSHGDSSKKKQTYTCLKSGAPYEKKCVRKLIVKVKVTHPHEKKFMIYRPFFSISSHIAYGSLMLTVHKHQQKEFDEHIAKKYPVRMEDRFCLTAFTAFKVFTIPKKVDISKGEWIDTCKDLEAMADKGLCFYKDLEKKGVNETRTINGEPVTRDHFEETRTYTCRANPLNTCNIYKNRGCQQTKSECIELDALKRCKTYRQTFVCMEHTKTLTHTFDGKNKPFCMDGNCVNYGDEKSNDFLDALTKLKVLDEMAKQSSGDPISVFSGKVRGCKKRIINFKDCCRCGKGWGKKLGLTDGCTAGEMALAKERMAKKCVLVGTYCSRKITVGLVKVCATKTTNFVCFPSKLARLIQEQGRRQLGMNFGTPEHPCARGLSISEMSRLNFDKMNFSEIFDEVRSSMRMPQTKVLEARVRSRVKSLQSNFAKKEKDEKK
jgi:hypothetical protein